MSEGKIWTLQVVVTDEDGQQRFLSHESLWLSGDAEKDAPTLVDAWAKTRDKVERTVLLYGWEGTLRALSAELAADDAASR